jgi:hypothetical protein
MLTDWLQTPTRPVSPAESGMHCRFSPLVHPKMNIGKESSRAECARLRSRHHCVTTWRVASTRQGFEWGARPSRLPFSASRRKPVNKLICPTMIRARRPNPHAERARSPQSDFRHRQASCVRHAPRPRSIENSPAIHGWDSWPAIFQSPVRDERTVLPSLAGLIHLMDAFPSHKWLGYCHRVAPRLCALASLR